MWQINISSVSATCSPVKELLPRKSKAASRKPWNIHGYDLRNQLLIRRSRLKNGGSSISTQPGSSPDTIVSLRDEDQPFIYDIRFSKKKFTLELYDTANPNRHWSSLRPDVVVLAYDISNRSTLDGLKAV